MRVEGGICGRGEKLRLGFRRSFRGLARLVILVGEIAEASDGGDTADGGDIAGELAAGLGAQNCGGKGTGLQGIVLGDIGGLPGSVTDASRKARHLRAEELFKKLLGVEHQNLL
ncbi:hypothetical protein D3C86_1635880 [compost metagenome]